MKLSVKFLAALAVIAMFVVGYIGSQQSASAAITGSVHLTNEFSDLTTESSPPTGRTFIGSGNTLYSTFQNLDAAGAVNQNTIMTDSNILVVDVIDADANVAVNKAVTGVNPTLGGIGNQTIVVVPQADSPIVDSNADGVVNSLDVTIANATGSVVVTDVAVSNVAAGSESTQAVVTLVSTTASDPAGTIDVTFKSSALDTLQVTLYSTAEPKPSNVNAQVKHVLQETGRSTGRFRGSIQLIDAEVTGSASASGVAPGLAVLRVLDGNTVTVEYSDATPTSGTSAVTVSQTSRVEISAPTPIITTPIHKSATTSQLPSFTGTVTETGAGLDVSEIDLYIDLSNDPLNGEPVIDTATSHGIVTLPLAGEAVSSSGVISPTLTGAPADGATNVAWTFTPSTNIPTGVAVPDNIVDFQVIAVDRAGNLGFSDSDAATTGAGSGTTRHEPHTVKIDRALPVLTEGRTGQYWDAAAKTTKSNRNTSVEALFNDDITGVDPTDFEVRQDNGVIHVPVTAEVFSDKPRSVFLTLGAALPSNDSPTITLKGQISDIAGNTTSAGSVEAVDWLAPVVTVELSGGSGTGTGATGPTGLTRNTIIATITSDEALSGSPTVTVYAEDFTGATGAGGTVEFAEASFVAIAQGGNVWRATISVAGLSDVAAKDKKSVVVMATDVSSHPNTRKVGTEKDEDSGAITFTADKTAPAANTTGVAATDRRPFVVCDFADNNTVTVTVFKVGADDVLTQIATTDNKKFFFVPTADMALGATTVTCRATDIAGNVGAEQTFTLTISERAAFVLLLFAGWNSVSVPSEPVDPDINTVFSNEDIDQVVAYNATDVASPWRIATKDEASDTFSSSTSTPLTTINAGWGYWVHQNSFASQEIDLQGPTGSTAGSPPPVVTIPTGEGWNFVGVVDQSRRLTTGNSTPPGSQPLTSIRALTRLSADGVTSVAVTVSTYFGLVNEDKVYRFNPATGQFLVVASSDSVAIGEGLWADIKPQADGSTPPIAP